MAISSSGEPGGLPHGGGSGAGQPPIPVLCPKCQGAVVWVSAAVWEPAGNAGVAPTPDVRVSRSVWLDAPTVCHGGCPLTPSQVEQVLLRAYAHVTGTPQQRWLFAPDEPLTPAEVAA